MITFTKLVNKTTFNIHHYVKITYEVNVYKTYFSYFTFVRVYEQWKYGLGCLSGKVIQIACIFKAVSSNVSPLASIGYEELGNV
jgi:hypothetical protein